jgi:RNA polymerase sigma-70 factor (ECF subfamily)
VHTPKAIDPVVVDPVVVDPVVIDDATLVVRAREGDLAAFEALVNRYQRRIYQLALRMTRNPADAEDIVQEVFLTAWRRLPEIQQDAAFSGWLYTSATNRCLNLLRRRRPTAELEEDDSPSDSSSVGTPAQDPQGAAQVAAQLAALTEALDQLTPEQRAVWLLREAHGRSYDEIARIIDTTPHAVRGRLSRARTQLAELMSPWH